jgi:hypothetical protein
MQLSLDTWTGVHASHERTENPDIDQVLDAVDRLDSRTHTEVTLTRENPWEFLAISGGPDYFLVSGEARDGSMPQLTNPDAPEGKVKLVCGGQGSEFNLRDVVPRDKVRGAVEQFFEGLSADLPAPWAVVTG